MSYLEREEIMLRKIYSYSIKFFKILRQEGLGFALEKTKTWLHRDRGPTLAYDFIGNVDLGKANFSKQNKKNGGKLVINWIIPDFFIGSGGHFNIFRAIMFLESFGHTCNIYIYGGTHFGTAKDAKKIIEENFFKLKASVYDSCDELTDSDALVATSWETAYKVHEKSNTRSKYYFVQDFEPIFFPMGSQYIFAENTYKLGFNCITAGKWLTQKMHEYGNKSTYYELAYDHDIYNVKNARKRKKQILYYARQMTPRRGFEIAVLALEQVKRKHPEVEIIFIGQKDSPKLTFEYTNGGVLTHEELANLYRESMLGISLSLTNYSLLPQEMMACGLPVVEADGENTRSVFGENNDFITLSELNPRDMAETINSLIEEDDERNRLANNALKHVEGLSWESSARIIEKAIKDGLK